MSRGRILIHLHLCQKLFLRIVLFTEEVFLKLFFATQKDEHIELQLTI